MSAVTTNASNRPGWPALGEILEAARHGTGEGVRVAVIDSGIEADHPRLAGLRLRDSVGFEEEDGMVRLVEGGGHDAYGHGTARRRNLHEVAPLAEVGSFRVIDARSSSRTHLICAGVREALRRGYRVLNCSFGCRGQAKFILPHKEWADEAWLQGAHVVAACSNLDSARDGVALALRLGNRGRSRGDRFGRALFGPTTSSDTPRRARTSRSPGSAAASNTRPAQFRGSPGRGHDRTDPLGFFPASVRP